MLSGLSRHAVALWRALSTRTLMSMALQASSVEAISMTRCIRHNYVICGLHPIRPLSEQKGERCQMKSLRAVTNNFVPIEDIEVHTIILKIQIKFKAFVVTRWLKGRS
jgi:hypothetical protein